MCPSSASEERSMQIYVAYKTIIASNMYVFSYKSAERCMFRYTKTEQYGRLPKKGKRSTLEFSGDVEGGKERLELKRYLQFQGKGGNSSMRASFNFVEKGRFNLNQE